MQYFSLGSLSLYAYSWFVIFILFKVYHCNLCYDLEVMITMHVLPRASIVSSYGSQKRWLMPNLRSGILLPRVYIQGRRVWSHVSWCLSLITDAQVAIHWVGFLAFLPLDVSPLSWSLAPVFCSVLQLNGCSFWIFYSCPPLCQRAISKILNF